jgi:ribonuclease-3
LSCGEKVHELKRIFQEALDSLDRDLRNQAFTHISYSNEIGERFSSNERLEFLGDAVISLAVALYLYENSPGISEGDLTRMRARVVSGASLANMAKTVGLGRYLILGRGEEITGGRARPRILAGAFEAVVGAHFIQNGWEPSRKLVVGLLMDRKITMAPVDPKTYLQEFVQKTSGMKLEYKVLNVEGPDHKPCYTIACLINGKGVSLGSGRSKKEAEENAARMFLEKQGLSDRTFDDKGNFAVDKIRR